MWERAPHTIFSGLFTLFILVLVLWHGRHDSARSWQYRHIFPARIYWGVPFLYILSGASITFSTFAAVDVGLSISSTPMQIFIIVSLLSMGAVYLFARKIAMPIFTANDIPQKDRNHLHGLWMIFLLVGWGVGLLPLLIPNAP